MCQLAVDCTDYIMVDIWETLHKEYVRTLPALKHFTQELNKNGGILTEDGIFFLFFNEYHLHIINLLFNIYYLTLYI